MVGRWIPGEVLSGPNPQGHVHLIPEFALHPGHNGGILTGFKPGSAMVGLNFGKNILAAAMKMENETDAVKTLGTLGKFSERRCE